MDPFRGLLGNLRDEVLSQVVNLEMMNDPLRGKSGRGLDTTCPVGAAALFLRREGS
jgi:hypothetical protein